MEAKRLRRALGQADTKATWCREGGGLLLTTTTTNTTTRTTLATRATTTPPTSTPLLRPAAVQSELHRVRGRLEAQAGVVLEEGPQRGQERRGVRICSVVAVAGVVVVRLLHHARQVGEEHQLPPDGVVLLLVVGISTER